MGGGREANLRQQTSLGKNQYIESGMGAPGLALEEPLEGGDGCQPSETITTPEHAFVPCKKADRLLGRISRAAVPYILALDRSLATSSVSTTIAIENLGMTYV